MAFFSPATALLLSHCVAPITVSSCVCVSSAIMYYFTVDGEVKYSKIRVNLFVNSAIPAISFGLSPGRSKNMIFGYRGCKISYFRDFVAFQSSLEEFIHANKVLEKRNHESKKIDR